MTIAEKARALGLSSEALQKRIQRRTGLRVRVHDEFTEELAAALNDVEAPPSAAGNAADRTAFNINYRPSGAFTSPADTVARPTSRVASDAPKKSLTVISVGADICLMAIPAMHAILIYQEATNLAGGIGSLFGVIVLLTTASAFLMSAAPKWHSVSGDALIVVLCLDVLSMFLHFEAFRQHVQDYLAAGFAGVLATLSFLSMYLYRQKNSTIKIFDE